MQKNMETEQLSGISALHQEKTICDWQASKEYLKKIMILRNFKDQFGFKNNFFSLALQTNNKNGKNVFFFKLLKN